MAPPLGYHNGMMRLIFLACLAGLLLPALVSGGERVVRTMPRENRFHLEDGRVVQGTILFSGLRGFVVAVADRDVFLPRDKVRRTERVHRPDHASETAMTVTSPHRIDTYEVTERNGAFVLRAKAGEIRTEDATETPEDDTTSVHTPEAPPAEASHSTALDEADAALAEGDKLARKARAVGTAKDSDRLYKKAVPLLKKAERLYRRALQKDKGNKTIERKLQEALKQRYWCEKMTRLETRTD